MFISLTYGPCIVGASNWNKTDNMEQYCGNNASLFNDRGLSLSDEAFLLVVLINFFGVDVED